MDPEVERRALELAAWHAEWSAKHAKSTPYRPESSDDPDYNIHYVDVSPSRAADDEYWRRAREIMGLDPETGFPMPDGRTLVMVGSFKLAAPVDPSTDDRLCECLQLVPDEGPVADFYPVFASRVTDLHDARVALEFFRDNPRNRTVNVCADRWPAPAAMVAVEAEVRVAAAACGLEMRSVYWRPTR